MQVARGEGGEGGTCAPLEEYSSSSSKLDKCSPSMGGVTTPSSPFGSDAIIFVASPAPLRPALPRWCQAGRTARPLPSARQAAPVMRTCTGHDVPAGPAHAGPAPATSCASGPHMFVTPSDAPAGAGVRKPRRQNKDDWRPPAVVSPNGCTRAVRGGGRQSGSVVWVRGGTC